MSEQGSEGREQLLDWEEFHVHPLPVQGFMLFVKGTAPVPMEVKLRSMPIGIVPEDYRGVEVVGTAAEAGPEVETPWSAEIETHGLNGRKGFFLKGATMIEYIPPKDS